MEEIKFYMQTANKDGVGVGEIKDLEADFPSLRYRACRGLNSVGKPKNIYSEDYPEADGERVFHPTDVEDGVIRHEATDVEMDFVFLGEEGKACYHTFCAFLEQGRTLYWDTVRGKKVCLVLDEKVDPEEDTVKGTIYLTATFKFRNIWGKALDV